MASESRKTAIRKKIAHLQFQLAPLVPLPEGPPHPDFPKSLLTYYLLTEEQLDAIAHHYGQSTPGFWTALYPANMNWDKEYLRKAASEPETRILERRQSQPALTTEWWQRFLEVSTGDAEFSKSEAEEAQNRRRQSVLSDTTRINIKRRKVGKFIGLLGMDTPFSEIEDKIQRSLERAIKLAREETRRMDLYTLWK